MYSLEKEDYEYSDEQNRIVIEKEVSWAKQEEESSKSVYFRDPAGNLVEFVTKDNWPVEDS